ncbi:MAG TPA: hypothetical protein VG370_05290 [Chloroflexota bacterium]|nr:hypothetical protein [Chloroflexota bacterium]
MDDARDWLARVSATILALGRVQAGWVARADDLPIARALAERVAEDFEHADLLFKRQYGLRAFPAEMARDSRIVPAWIAQLEAAPSLLACLVAVYRTVKPRLLVEIRRYCARTAPNADGPTLRQLELIAPELQEQIVWGADAIARAGERDPAGLAADSGWAAQLEQSLVAAGGFFGETIASDRALWRWRGAPRPDVPALRQLAATVYAAYDLPWDGVLGIARHLGDLGRLADHLPSGGGPTRRTRGADLPARLGALADLLDATVAAPTGEPAAFAAAAVRSAAAHAREWAGRLASAAQPKPVRNGPAP